MQTKILGRNGNELIVDPTHLAARVCNKPLEYSDGTTTLGHYAVAQLAQTASPAYGGHRVAIAAGRSPSEAT